LRLVSEKKLLIYDTDASRPGWRFDFLRANNNTSPSGPCFCTAGRRLKRVLFRSLRRLRRSKNKSGNWSAERWQEKCYPHSHVVSRPRFLLCSPRRLAAGIISFAEAEVQGVGALRQKKRSLRRLRRSKNKSGNWSAKRWQEKCYPHSHVVSRPRYCHGLETISRKALDTQAVMERLSCSPRRLAAGNKCRTKAHCVRKPVR